MPNRLIRDGFVDSERVNGLTWFGQAVYVRMMIKADDAGRLDGRPARLLTLLFPLGFGRGPDGMALGADGVPMPSDAIRMACAEIEKAGLAHVYEVAGKPYLQLHRWQKCFNTTRSKYPDANGLYAFEFLEMDGPQGPKKYVRSSIPGNPPRTPPKDGDEDADGDADGDSGRGADAIGMASGAGSVFFASQIREQYKRLKACERFQDLTRVQWGAVCSKLAESFPLVDCVTELLRKSELATDIRRPGAWLDAHVSYWSRDNPELVLRARKEHARLSKEVAALAEALVEVQDPEQVKRMRARFLKLEGRHALEMADHEAEIRKGAAV